jgi:hypothetical protein
MYVDVCSNINHVHNQQVLPSFSQDSPPPVAPTHWFAPVRRWIASCAAAQAKIGMLSGR